MDKQIVWKEFRVGDLFDFVAGKQPLLKDRFDNKGKDMVPVITGITLNNGIGFYTTKNGKQLYRNILTISKDGEYAGTVYLQDEEVYLGGHSLGLIPKINMDSKILLYIASRFVSFQKQGFWKTGVMVPSVQISKIDKLKILLPATADDAPDWKYMAERIKELEAERIKELEAYLLATGLSDYELTEADKQIMTEMLSKEKVITRLDIMKLLLKCNSKNSA